MAISPSARPLKERQREEREQFILQAAEELFLERGFHETTIDDIAGRVGIAKGTVYLHFPSKEELALALVEQNLTQFLATLDEILSSDRSPREKLLAVIEQVYTGKTGKHFQLLHAALQNPEFRGRLNDSRQHQHDRWHDLATRVGQVVEEGKTAGEFDAAVPTPVLISIFMSFIVPIHYANLIVRERMAADDVVRYLGQCLSRAIAAPTGREEVA